MSTIVTRAVKGSALTHTEGDANFTNLNDDKLENIVEDTTPQLGGNLDVGVHSIVSVSNADITIAPNGTGIVLLASDLEVGYGTGPAAITSSGAHDLDLVTNGGVDSGLIRIQDGVDGDIQLIPDGTGRVHFETSETRVGINNTNAKITTKGTGDLTLDTNSGTNSGSIVIADGVNGTISITPNGTGKSTVSAINYNEGAIHTVTFASTITPDVANGNVQTVTLTGAVTFSAFANPIAGQSLTLRVLQDSTGSRLLTSTMKFAGASKTLSTAANSIDMISVYFDGTTYFASLAKGFA